MKRVKLAEFFEEDVTKAKEKGGVIFKANGRRLYLTFSH